MAKCLRDCVYTTDGRFEYIFNLTVSPFIIILTILKSNLKSLPTSR